MDVNKTIREVADGVFKLAKERDRYRDALLQIAQVGQHERAFASDDLDECVSIAKEALRVTTADDVRGILAHADSPGGDE